MSKLTCVLRRLVNCNQDIIFFLSSPFFLLSFKGFVFLFFLWCSFIKCLNILLYHDVNILRSFILSSFKFCLLGCTMLDNTATQINLVLFYCVNSAILLSFIFFSLPYSSCDNSSKEASDNSLAVSPDTNFLAFS